VGRSTQVTGNANQALVGRCAKPLAASMPLFQQRYKQPLEAPYE
jgi:hypothetical protein